MTAAAERLLHWTPRVLTLLVAAFTGVFALDVFEGAVPAWRVALALRLPLVPTFPVLLSGRRRTSPPRRAG